MYVVRGGEEGSTRDARGAARAAKKRLRKRHKRVFSSADNRQERGRGLGKTPSKGQNQKPKTGGRSSFFPCEYFSTPDQTPQAPGTFFFRRFSCLCKRLSGARKPPVSVFLASGSWELKQIRHIKAPEHRAGLVAQRRAEGGAARLPVGPPPP